MTSRHNGIPKHKVAVLTAPFLDTSMNVGYRITLRNWSCAQCRNILLAIEELLEDEEQKCWRNLSNECSYLDGGIDRSSVETQTTPYKEISRCLDFVELAEMQQNTSTQSALQMRAGEVVRRSSAEDCSFAGHSLVVAVKCSSGQVRMG